MAELKEQFAAAAAAAKGLKRRPDNDALLQLYALYKQATVGDVTGKRPGFTDLVGRAKYDAWAKLQGTPGETAMQRYIALVDKLQRA
ncbi:MAG TPA: acyl-CoA-binding protein [Caldilineaceae bacterium]|nr:acyl-CoA-binding protein [Caldilineaceae bacterium]